MMDAIVTALRFAEWLSCVEGKMCYHSGSDLTGCNRRALNNTGLNMRLYFFCHETSQEVGSLGQEPNLLFLHP